MPYCIHGNGDAGCLLCALERQTRAIVTAIEKTNPSIRPLIPPMPGRNLEQDMILIAFHIRCLSPRWRKAQSPRVRRALDSIEHIVTLTPSGKP